MIRRIVDFALNNRFLVLGGALLLFVWGVVSFHNLPVEAYPDVANNYVNIITQWPGHSAEDIEKQVTVPTEIQMAGIPHLQHLRSTTLAGLSSIMLIFDDESDNNWNRERSRGKNGHGFAAYGPGASIGHRLEPCRPDLLLHNRE